MEKKGVTRGRRSWVLTFCRRMFTSIREAAAGQIYGEWQMCTYEGGAGDCGGLLLRWLSQLGVCWDGADWLPRSDDSEKRTMNGVTSGLMEQRHRGCVSAYFAQLGGARGSEQVRKSNIEFCIVLLIGCVNGHLVMMSGLLVFRGRGLCIWGGQRSEGQA